MTEGRDGSGVDAARIGTIAGPGSERPTEWDSAEVAEKSLLPL
jgi:hypothetical protein